MTLRVAEIEPPAPAHAVMVSEGVLWARLPLAGPLRHVNCYAFEDDEGWTLFDCGIDSPETRAAWQALCDGPLKGRPITRVIVSHHHPDHIGLAGWFQAQGARLLTTRTAWLYARMLWLDEQRIPAPETLAYWRMAGMTEAEIAAKAETRPFNFHDVISPLPLGFERVQSGDTLTLGGRRFRARLGQGHAPDQLTLWQEDGPLVLIADQCLAHISPNIGVYPTEPGANPLAEFLQSCAALQAVSRPDHLALPGHGRPFYGLAERLAALMAEHEAGLAALVAHLAHGPATVTGCFDALYRRPIRPHEQGLALAETLAHLNYLEQTGQACRQMVADTAQWRGVTTGAC